MQRYILTLKISNNFDIERQCLNFCWSLTLISLPMAILIILPYTFDILSIDAQTHARTWCSSHVQDLTNLYFHVFFIFLYYNWLLYFPINKFFFVGREKSQKSPPPLYFLNTSQKLAPVALCSVNWLCAHRPCFPVVSMLDIYLFIYFLAFLVTIPVTIPIIDT